MSEFLEANQVLEQLQIRDVQLVWYIEQGLTPYDRFCEATVVARITSAVLEWAITIDQEIDTLEAQEDPEPLFLELRKNKKRNLIDAFQMLSSESLEGLTDAFRRFDDPLKQLIVDRLMGALYLQADVDKLKHTSVKPRQNQIDRDLARKLACEIVAQTPTIQQNEMGFKLKEHPELRGYDITTLMRWTKDIHPAHTPGKPGRKKTKK